MQVETGDLKLNPPRPLANKNPVLAFGPDVVVTNIFDWVGQQKY